MGRDLWKRDQRVYCFYKADGNFLFMLVFFLVFFYEILLFKYVLLISRFLNTHEHI